MEYFLKPLSRQETEEFVGRIMKHFDEHGYGLYAVDELESKAFIGFIGFQWVPFSTDFTPCVEIGWRIHPAFWRRGLATEGANRCLEHGFLALGLQEICSFTAALNSRSIAVMTRIGLRHRKDFSHPRIDPAHRLSKHVLYSLRREEYHQTAHEARMLRA